MSLKWAIIISIMWIMLVMAVCLGLLLYNAGNLPQRQLNARAATAGRGAGTFVAVTLAPLWLYFAVQYRKRRS